MKKKKRKLNLDDLEIESFATTVASEVVGGGTEHDITVCLLTCQTCNGSCGTCYFTCDSPTGIPCPC